VEAFARKTFARFSTSQPLLGLEIAARRSRFRLVAALGPRSIGQVSNLRNAGF
jgi:hypothetical protein